MPPHRSKPDPSAPEHLLVTTDSVVAKSAAGSYFGSSDIVARMSDSSNHQEKARQAGRALARRAARLDEQHQAPMAVEGRADADRLAAQLAATMSEEDRGEAAQLADLEADRLAEPDQRESRRTTPMSFALRADLKDRLNKFRSEGGNINVSGLANDTIERELDRIESGNALVQRLRVELTERRGTSWTWGYQAGQKWAEEDASWLEITEQATRYTNRDVKVETYNEDSPYMYAAFTGRFRAPTRDYGRDAHDSAGAPAFRYANEDGEMRGEYRIDEMEAYWRAWLTAVREIYDNTKAYLPSVIDQLPAEEITDLDKPRDADPDDIPF